MKLEYQQIETRKKNHIEILELKNTIIEFKNSLERLKGRLNQA